MKKLILSVVIAFGIISVSNAQSLFQGFFKSDEVAVKEQMIKNRDLAGEFAKLPFIVRPAVFGTLTGVQFGGGKPEVKAFDIFGLGVSLTKYSTVNEKVWCDYSFNATVITTVNGTFKVGGAVTVDAFNKVIGIGVGYIDNHPMLLTTFSYSF